MQEKEAISGRLLIMNPEVFLELRKKLAEADELIARLAELEGMRKTIAVLRKDIEAESAILLESLQEEKE